MKYLLALVLLITLALALTGVTAHAENPDPVFHILPHGTPIPFKPGNDNGARCDRMCINPFVLDHDTCTCVMPEMPEASERGDGFRRMPHIRPHTRALVGF